MLPVEATRQAEMSAALKAREERMAGALGEHNRGPDQRLMASKADAEALEATQKLKEKQQGDKEPGGRWRLNNRVN